MAVYEFIKTDWFAKRLNALIVPFPDNLTEDILKGKIYGFNADEVLSALKQAHVFLQDILTELLSAGEAERYQIIDKYNLLWIICAVGELEFVNNRYCININKQELLKAKMKYKPVSVIRSLNSLEATGFEFEYYKDSIYSNKQEYKNCDTLKVILDNNIALGIWIYVRRVIEKQWYNEYDRAGNYCKTLDISPMNHCIEPYHRVDMRMFLSDERMKYDIIEQMAGYDEKTTALFKLINDYMKENYPEISPNQGFFRYLFCTVSYNYDYLKRHMGAIGLGNENEIGFYTSFKGKELDIAFSELDSYSDMVAQKFLYNNGENDPAWVKKSYREVTYKGKKYICPYTSLELRFPIIDEKTANDCIRLMTIKAESKQGIK